MLTNVLMKLKMQDRVTKWYTVSYSLYTVIGKQKNCLEICITKLKESLIQRGYIIVFSINISVKINIKI